MKKRFNKVKKNERGFAIALALLLLVVMSLMGVSLLLVASGDHKRNANHDTRQQAFYAAETGIQEAKKWLSAQTSFTPQTNPDSRLVFCKSSLFPELSDPRAINNYIEIKNLSQVITGQDADEIKRLQNYGYEFFITYTPNLNGQTTTATNKTVAGASGTDISESTSYKDGGTSKATYFNIYSCGCNTNPTQCKSGTHAISALQSTVTIVN